VKKGRNFSEVLLEITLMLWEKRGKF